MVKAARTGRGLTPRSHEMQNSADLQTQYTSKGSFRSWKKIVKVSFPGVVVWGSCSVGELWCGGVAVWVSCGVRESRCGGVAMWGSRGVGELRCEGVAV